MGAVGGLLGLSGGAAGTGFAGPSSANILNPTTVAQTGTAYDTAQNALGQQQNFVNALGAQNGIGNQSSVFNQLQGVANGTGPNPAQNMLNQATGANVANQAALMAGQRGSNANVGLIARQAAMQGANTQQQAAGQNATLQSQQQLNALSGLGNLATQQVGQQQQGLSNLNTQSQNEQQNLLNSVAQQNNANVGMQSNVNTANAGLAGTTMQGQQAMLGGLGNAAGSIGKLFADGGKVPMYANGVTSVPQVGQYAPIDPNAPDVFDSTKTNSGAPVQMQAPAAAVPAAVSAAPKPMAAPSAPPPAVNKPVAPNAPAAQSQPNFGNPGANALYKGVSGFGKFLADQFSGSGGSKPSSDDQYAGSGFSASQMADERSRADAINAGGLPAQSDVDQNYGQSNPQEQMSGPDQMPTDNSGNLNSAKGGKVPAMVSPGERYLPPKEVAEVKAGKKSPMEAGEKIPGKPKVAGAKNSYANDTVPKDLEEGGLVLPRSVTQAKHPHWAALKFVQAHMAQGGKVLPPKPKAKK